MSARLVYFNGEFVPESEARVSIFDSALMFGDMAFEVTRTYNHRPFGLRAHLERLYASLRLLEIDCGLTIEDMERITLETLHKNLPTEAGDVDWLIIHDVSRGPLHFYHTAFEGKTGATVAIACWPLITHMGGFAQAFRDGIHLMIPAQQALPAHLVDPKAKTRSRLHYRMAELQGLRSGGKWAVMLDTDGFLAEGSGWNILLVKDRVLYSPESRNILLGVSRATTIELAGQLGIEVRQANLGRYEALTADEIFCTATTYSLVHASSFEGQTVGDGTPGPVFQALLEAWKEKAGLDFVAQADLYAQRMPQWLKQDASARS